MIMTITAKKENALTMIGKVKEVIIQHGIKDIGVGKLENIPVSKKGELKDASKKLARRAKNFKIKKEEKDKSQSIQLKRTMAQQCIKQSS